MENSNSAFMDLYGDCLKPFVELPINATFDDIKKIAATNTQPKYIHKIKIGEKCVVAETKYTWKGNVAKTSYLHIAVLKNIEGRLFEDWKELWRRTYVVQQWREQKNGTFK